jgi:hypothetical protein
LLTRAAQWRAWNRESTRAQSMAGLREKKPLGMSLNRRSAQASPASLPAAEYGLRPAYFCFQIDDRLEGPVDFALEDYGKSSAVRRADDWFFAGSFGTSSVIRPLDFNTATVAAICSLLSGSKGCCWASKLPTARVANAHQALILASSTHRQECLFAATIFKPLAYVRGSAAPVARVSRRIKLPNEFLRRRL